MPARKKSMNVNVGIQGVHPFSKTVKKRAPPKYRKQSSKSTCVTQSMELSINHFQSADLVKFVKQRRAFPFDPSYTNDSLFSIFDKATGGNTQNSYNNLRNFDLVSGLITTGDTQSDSIKCQEVRFYSQYTLLRYDMDFGAVCTWKQTSGDANISFRNPSFHADVVGVVSGSTWLITLMLFPLALAMTSGNLIDTHHTATAGLMGMQIGAPIGAMLGCVFGPVGFAIGGLAGSLMGIATGFGGCYLERQF